MFRVNELNELNELNEQQMTSVTADPNRAIIVVASPGSGKTRVLVERVAYLVEDCDIDPDDVLVTTFTRRAADEMKIRLEPLIGDRVNGLRIGTIHSVCLRILREERMSRELIRDNEQRSILRDELGYKRLNWDVGWRYPLSWIMKAKARLVTPREAEDFFMKRLESLCGNKWQAMDLSQKLAQCYQAYETEKRHLGRMDFADMLMWVEQKFRDDEQFRALWQTRVQYVLVDEAQDTSAQAYSILRTLAAPENRFFAVGDPDQELFRWAGADPDHNIYGFLGFYPDGEILPLEINYRSTKTIVDVSNKTILANYDGVSEERLKFKKSVEPRPDAPEGKAVVVQRCADTEDEADYICRTVEEMLEEGRNPSDIYVVYRVNSQSRVVEDVFLRAKIPYVVQGSLGFYDRAMIKDMLAYLALIEDENDNEAFDRVANIASGSFTRPTRGIGAKWKAECSALAKGHHESMWQSMLRMRERATKWYMKSIDDFVDLVEGIREQSGKDPRVAVSMIRSHCYESYLMRNDGMDETAAMDKGLFDNLDELGYAVTQFESIADFLEYVEEMRELQRERQKENVDAVVLTTIHRVKGLERPVVFGIGLSEDILPHRMALSGGSYDHESNLPIENLGGLSDERCAAFVMVSRAKDELYLSYPVEYRNSVKKPSRFLREMGLIEDVQELPDEEEALDTVTI